ncbi:MAG: DUF58 domain-containing protein [Oleispira antarctica]|nr:DUF58 domain-containing protein [Oleispira antarctica]MBQ0792562.1 DUF58 domain-containing protein [Oleispira antarctica]
MTPSKKLLIIAALFLPCALAADFYPPITTGLYTVAVIFLLLMLFDAVRGGLIPNPHAERQIEANLAVQTWNPVTLTLTNETASNIKMSVFDSQDESTKSQGLPQSLMLTPNSQAIVEYQIKATQRGNIQFNDIDCLLQSPWGFWHLRRSILCESQVRVQPNYKSVFEFALLGDEQKLAKMGNRQQRRRGEGTEFHQLRAYQAGDPMRKIDWKASSRIGKLISKEFQDEQDQQLVFLLDTGRRMRHKDEDVEHMDQTLNSMLLLSHVAAKQGDSVGFMAFGNNHTWCPPRKHKAIVKHLLDHCYGLHAGLVMSDYLVAAQRLIGLQKRRALVIILTNSRDEDRNDLEKAVLILRKRHLVVVADLHESFLADTLKQDPKNFEQSLEMLTTENFMRQRQEMHSSLNNLGAMCLDCTAEELPATLVNSYQHIKNSGRL